MFVKYKYFIMAKSLRICITVKWKLLICVTFLSESGLFFPLCFCANRKKSVASVNFLIVKWSVFNVFVKFFNWISCYLVKNYQLKRVLFVFCTILSLINYIFCITYRWLIVLFCETAIPYDYVKANWHVASEKSAFSSDRINNWRFFP